MKKYLLLLPIFLGTNLIFSQTSFIIGFNKGWKEGYCYNQNGCVAPVAPVAPVPTASESSDNYKDGYNRGFQMGLDKKRSNSASSNSAGVGAGVPTKAVTTDFGSITQQGLSGFGNARMNEWQNMRQRRLLKYLNSPTKKTTIKLYRANKVLGLPYDEGIASEHFWKWVSKKL